VNDTTRKQAIAAAIFAVRDLAKCKDRANLLPLKRSRKPSLKPAT